MGKAPPQLPGQGMDSITDAAVCFHIPGHLHHHSTAPGTADQRSHLHVCGGKMAGHPRHCLSGYRCVPMCLGMGASALWPSSAASWTRGSCRGRRTSTLLAVSKQREAGRPGPALEDTTQHICQLGRLLILSSLDFRAHAPACQGWHTHQGIPAAGTPPAGGTQTGCPAYTSCRRHCSTTGAHP